jgi:hypothetical protein
VCVVLAPTRGSDDFLDIILVATAQLAAALPELGEIGSSEVKAMYSLPQVLSPDQREQLADQDEPPLVVLDVVTASTRYVEKLWGLYARHTFAADQRGVPGSVGFGLRGIFSLLRRYGTLLDSASSQLPMPPLPRIAASYLQVPEQASRDSVPSLLSPAMQLSATAMTAFGVVAAAGGMGGPTEGTGMHAAAPETVFETLSRELGVTAEVFASPLNAFYSHFCSAFPDTDRYFGSLGSFFDFETCTGSFECNPPFCDEVMDACAVWLEHLLSRSSAPLSFAVMVPHWSDPPTRFIPAMEQSRFTRQRFIIAAYQHRYISGAQHAVSSQPQDRYFKAVHETAFFIMQNDAGAAKWPATPAVVERIRKAFA